MPSKIGRTTEREMAIAVMRFLASQPHGEATQEEIRCAIPAYIDLTEGDMEDSPTRPGERLWEQIIRNINSHKNNSTNFIFLGYLQPVTDGFRITQEGLDFLESLDEAE